MVKKLFRQEMNYYVRSLLPVYIILLGVALMGRIIQIFESDSWVYDTVSISAGVAYGVAIVATLGLSVLFCIVRYYKNMFTGEGYLTLTLPVKYSTHLKVKLGAALATILVSVVAVLLSLVVFLTTDWLVELWKAAAYIWNDVAKVLGVHLGLYALEFVLLVLVALAMEILLFYMCVSLGQTAKKNRVLAAVGIYFGIYLATQILMTVLIIVLNFNVELFQSIFSWIELHPRAAVHVLLLVAVAFYGLLSLGMYFISRRVLYKRLNLE